MESREESIERDKILMSVKRTSLLMDPFFKIGAAGTVMMVVFLARMVKEHKLNKGEFKDFQEFLKATGGKYKLVNIPVDKKNGLAWLGQSDFSKELDKLRELGIRFTVMPDLNEQDSFQQLAVYEEDKEKFAAWYESYLASKMQGGEKELENLKAFTEGQVSIVSVPLEGKEKFFEQDFKTLGINYAILPDLHVGDGDIHLIAANTDLDKLQYWYEKYKEDCFNAGEEVKDMKVVEMKDYTRTGELTEEQYIDTAGEELKKANEKYEGKEPGVIENSVRSQETGIKSETDEAYEKFKADKGYQEISINRDTLVDNMSLGEEQQKKLVERGMFASRIPGTYLESEQILLVPTEQVFQTDNGQTYLAFLEKNEKPLVLDRNGKPIPVMERSTGAELFQKSYNPVNQKFAHRNKIQIGIDKPVENVQKGIPPKAPAPPLKVK